MAILDFPTTGRRSTGTPRAGTDTAITDLDRPAPSSCMHERTTACGLTLDICPQTDEAQWLDGASQLDPAEALARLFGAFDLMAALPGPTAPGETVLVYLPDSRRGRQAMRALPAARWIHAAPGLWITHDGDHLLMSPSDPLLAHNLARDLTPDG